MRERRLSPCGVHGADLLPELCADQGPHRDRRTVCVCAPRPEKAFTAGKATEFPEFNKSERWSIVRHGNMHTHRQKVNTGEQCVISRAPGSERGRAEEFVRLLINFSACGCWAGLLSPLANVDVPPQRRRPSVEKWPSRPYLVRVKSSDLGGK